MKKDEARLQQLIEDPEDDRLLEEDMPLIRAGLLHLNWTDRSEGRCHPFVTPSPAAAKYLDKDGRITPANRRTLRELVPGTTRADISWASAHIQPNYNA